MIMKIAICDDLPADLKLLQTYCSRYDPGIPAVAFSSGEALLAAYDEDFYDLVFVAAEIEPMNALALGSRLLALPRRPLIVFTARSLHYAVHGYGIAMRFLPKPIGYDTFSEVMAMAMEQLVPRKIILFSGREQLLVPVNEILYFEVLRHQVCAHLSRGESISARGTLSEIIRQLPHSAFVQPHKSYYINLEYVARLTPQGIVMTNGDHIPIGRSKKDHFRLRLRAYMKGDHAQNPMG